MKLAYLGSPQAAVAPLLALAAAGHEIALVVTGPDKRRGRGSGLSPTPVKAAALELGLKVTDQLGDVAAESVDLGVVVAFGRIIPAEMLAQVPMVNLHFSLLPRWRGAAPVERAILAGDPTTGVCVMDVAVGLDTGDVYACEKTPIGGDETASELRDRLTAIGADLLVRTLGSGLGAATPQSDSGITYAEKIGPEDRRLTSSMGTEEFLRVTRIGGAWTQFRGKRFKVLSARPAPAPTKGEPSDPGVFIEGAVLATTDGAVELLSVQPEGKAAMSAADWARGAHPAGDRIAT